MSAVDFCLFVMLLWARKFDVAPPAPLAALRDRMMLLDSVQRAMKREGLT